MKGNILIIEDDMDVAEILKFALVKEGYKVEVTPNGLEAENFINSFKPNLIILDVMLNDTDGFTVCRIISAYKIPIIMVTARGDITDKILGLELGADDYITKPFDIREVLMRVRVALRRREAFQDKMKASKDANLIRVGNIIIDEDMRTVYCNKEEIKLKPKEFDLILFLSKNLNKVFSREQLVERIWGYDYLGDSRTIDVHITRIRSKLKENVHIETVFGVGYVLKEKIC